jgi:hypothetical protein
MTKLSKLIVFGVLLSSMSIPALGQQLSGIAGTFVDIGFGARASGMGFAYTGLAEDADAVVWNPAGMGQAEKINISLMYTKQYDLVNYNYAAGVVPLKNNHVVGFALISSGDEVLRENTVYASYANTFFGKLHVGGTLKYRASSFGNNTLNAGDYVVFTPGEMQQGFDRQVFGTGRGLGFDVGILFKSSEKLQFGIIARDPFSTFTWDSKIRSESTGESAKGSYQETVPFEIIAGVAYNFENHLYITTDIQPSIYEAGAEILRAGIEKKFLDILLLRAGTEQKLKSLDIDHYMVGFGLDTPELNGVRLSANYSYVMNELTNTHRIGVQLKF